MAYVTNTDVIVKVLVNEAYATRIITEGNEAYATNITTEGNQAYATSIATEKNAAYEPVTTTETVQVMCMKLSIVDRATCRYQCV